MRYYLKYFSFAFLFLYAGCSPVPEKNQSWTMYKADAESTSYSALKQINKNNVTQLQLAWAFDPKDAADGNGFGSECNPIVIDTIMYFASQRHRIYAVNAMTGKKIWSFDPFNGGQYARSGGQCRGVTYWKDGQESRILFTAGHYLFAIDALTGKPFLSFGKKGRVDLNVGMRDDPDEITVVSTSPGIIYKNLIILGSWSPDFYQGVPGYERAFDVRTGKLVWTFHTIPQPGDPGYETWPEGAWKRAGGANDWGGMSLDKERGIVFLATGSPSYDYYGADRIGMNLFGNCIVALEAATGKLKWYFQTVHHDLWDYDLPAPPNLVTFKKDGKSIDAVAQVSKTGFLYVLDRETGEPVFPIEERKVPASDMPGEQAWPTQPFPLKPGPYSRQYITEKDLSNFSKEGHDSLVKAFNALRYEGLFTPPSRQGTLTLPASTGGAEWGGGAFDPETGILYVKSNNSPETAILKMPFEVDKIRLENAKSQYAAGKIIYSTYCSGCHGDNRKGVGVYPSLEHLKNTLPIESAIRQIQQGGGKMPAYETVIKGNKLRALIAYLYEFKNGKRFSQHSAHDKTNDKKELHVSEKRKLQKYVNLTAYRHFRDPSGNPGIKPPWGLLNAIDLNTGEYIWRVPVGNIPELQKKGEPPTGMGSMTGPVVTGGGLVFIGGTRDKKFRAYDKNTGELLWETMLPGVASSLPSTYSCNGKQYIAVSVSGNEKQPAGSVMVFTLPE